MIVSIHSHECAGAVKSEPAEFCVEFAHRCIDAGAHAIVGTGPHMLRPIEIYKGCPIFYSLGDFIIQLETVKKAPVGFFEKQGMTGSEGLFGPPLQAAQTIKDRIHRELGFTVNIGIAPNRLLAKMASDFEKPDKIHVLTQDMVPQKLWPLPVGNLFGVGPKSVKRMHEIGIYTIGDLANADADILRGVFGVRGQVFRDYANGIESEPMTRSEVKDNSYGNSVTTPQDLKRPVEADATMLALCESVAGRLRMDGKTARVITVQLVDNAFRRSSHQVTLNSPTNSTDVIYHTARELMRQMWPDRPVRLVGVSAEKTGTDNFEQLDFFTDPAKTDKQEKLDRAADALRARFGEGAILRAKLLHPDEKTTAPKALGAAKARDKRKGEL